jgi:D-alanyl-D-alanine carboxypeptidase (penicillin-binding protein 5/6)
MFSAKKKIIHALALLILTSVSFLLNVPAHSQSCPFNASSISALLIDAGSGQIIYSQNPYQRMQPASLAKIMTLFLIFDAMMKGDVTLNDEVVINKKAAQKKGSTMYLREGEKIQLLDLIKGIAIVSGNDACVAVADKLFGSEQAFLDEMNRKLQDLNLQNTKFQTVDGWPATDQYTTAYDIAMISKAYIQKHPQALEYHKLKEFSHADIVLHNRNRLILQDPSVDGLKTGHVEEAGYHLIATAKRGDQRYIAVIMGAENIEFREKEAMQLLDFGFSNFVTMKLFDKNDILFQLPVLNGVKKEVGLTPTEDGVTLISISQKDNISYEIDSAAQQEAPIEVHQNLGKVLITYRNNILKSISLIANEEIERKDAKTLALESFKSFATKQKYMLLVIIILICFLVIQMLYIIKLRRQIKKTDIAGSEIAKKRLERMLK